MKKHCWSKNKVGPEVKKVSVTVSEVSECVGNCMYACLGYVRPFSPPEPKVVQFGCYHKIFGKILSKRGPKCKNLKKHVKNGGESSHLPTFFSPLDQYELFNIYEFF